MGIPLTIVDAFTDAPFGGNPAAVCRLDKPAGEDWMQAVAAELDFPMTAFVSPRPDGDFDLRWFTAVVEVPLCGHATLATGHVLNRPAVFHTKSGRVACRPAPDGAVELDFPAIPADPVDEADLLAPAIGLDRSDVLGVWRTGEWRMVEVASAQTVRAARPDREALLRIGGIVVVVATPGETPGCDSACRVFEPESGLDEDPVTGSAHCVIAPWLAARTGRTEFAGEQLSARGGRMGMRVEGDRVVLRGRAVTVAEGELRIPPA